MEVPPTEGTLLAFRRSNNSWHGHKPFSGLRRVIQFNWVTSEAVVRRSCRAYAPGPLVVPPLPPVPTAPPPRPLPEPPPLPPPPQPPVLR